MKICSQFLFFTVSLIILSLLFVSITWGETDIEKVVIGKGLTFQGVEPQDYGAILIPKDLFPEGKGLPIPIYVPSVENNSNASFEGWHTIKKISGEEVRFSQERLLRNAVIFSVKHPGAELILALTKTFAEAFDENAFLITIQRSPQGEFRAVIQISTDEMNVIRAKAGGVVSSPSIGLPAIVWSRYLQERFSLPSTKALYRSAWIIDKNHKKDPYVAYLSLRPEKNAVAITPKVYPNDAFKIMKEIFILGPIVLELKGGEYIAAWSYLMSVEAAKTLKILELLPISPVVQHLSVTSSLRLTPQKDKYQVGDILTAKFVVCNKSYTPITLDVLMVGGRLNNICPQGKCPDFTWKKNVTLQPNQPNQLNKSYHYEGKLKLKTAGKYHFFTAYSVNGQWNTAIPTAPGITNTKDIIVSSSSECTGGFEYTHEVYPNNLFDREGSCGFKEGCRGYCTWYAAEKWLWDENEELPSTRNAHYWIEDAKKKGFRIGEKPVKGSIVVFGITNKNPAGHVAYVESVDNQNGTFVISQMNAGSKLDPKTLKTECFNKITKKTLNFRDIVGKNILGFIYPSVKEKPSATGLATALVMDVSGSMGAPSGRGSGERKIDVAAEEAKAFIDRDVPSNYCSLSVFSDTGWTVVKMSPLKKAKDTLIKGISKLSPQTSTNFTAGLDKAYNELNSLSVPGSKKAAVFLSDGRHNVGPWSDVISMVEKFARRHWKIYTLGFGEDVDEDRLYEMATKTKGIYFKNAQSDNIHQTYDLISSEVTCKVTLYATCDYLPRGGQLTYSPIVSPGAEKLQVNPSFLGSKLDTKLISPGGKAIGPKDLTGDFGRYEEGKTYQMLEVNHPESGQWQVKIKWAVPPPNGERINVTILEKTDVVANILGFKSEYKLGEPVDISVHVAELIGNEDVPLKDPKVTVKIYKPGPEVIQAVVAGTAGWAMYKDVLQNNIRTLVLYDDGQHNDYEANDGIFSNTFSETDKNGPYIAVVRITGTRENGEVVKREIKASFQVGPIVNNKVTVSREIDWLENMSSKSENLAPQSEDLLKQPAKQIDNLLNKSNGSKSNKKVEDLLE